MCWSVLGKGRLVWHPYTNVTVVILVPLGWSLPMRHLDAPPFLFPMPLDFIQRALSFYSYLTPGEEISKYRVNQDTFSFSGHLIRLS